MNICFNAHHSPLGAHSSFTLGHPGKKGGLGVELGTPANQDIYIGLQSRTGKDCQALPFYTGADDQAARYDHARKKAKASDSLLHPFAESAISRDYQLGTDTWAAGDLSFTIYSPVEAAPDPEKSAAAAQKLAYCPSLLAELVIDNRQCSRERTAFVGFGELAISDSIRVTDNLPAKYQGIAQGNTVAIVTDSPSAIATQGFGVEQILKETTKENYSFGLGSTSMILVRAAAKKVTTVRFAVCLFRAGIVTSGVATSYWYSRFFPTIESVAQFTLKNAASFKARALKSNRMIDRKKLNPAQAFQLTHAIRSYQGSTQLLDWDGKPFWVVNEGEYRMMNTFDLTVDQVFYEMKMNPWTVRNELDMFVNRYSYTDRVHAPGGENIHAGGISFTHDMGRNNRISRPGYSTYECFNLSGCFSHMTHEQLVNWVLCAAVYAHGSGDHRWLKANLPVLVKCLRSLVNRDDPDDSQRNGIMGYDSSRTLSGAEITTYDSLDASLGQARNNLYLAVKTWAAYLALECIFFQSGKTADAKLSGKQAARAAATISKYQDKEGMLPAILGEKCDSRIISAIEGLAFPYVLDMPKALDPNGEYGELIRALSTHLQAVLRKGVCLYADGGWKLSSSADNSWLSKIYLCQFVARKILGVSGPAAGEKADQAHFGWLLKKENLYWAWSDQMRSGVAMGSKYYPRGVTSILWLEE